jgi:hypothetical protein
MIEIKYSIPRGWIQYDPVKITSALTEAKAAVLSLKTIPYQKRWVETLQQIELKREVAGTSRIEGAEFTVTHALTETSSSRGARVPLDFRNSS